MILEEPDVFNSPEALGIEQGRLVPPFRVF